MPDGIFRMLVAALAIPLLGVALGSILYFLGLNKRTKNDDQN